MPLKIILTAVAGRDTDASTLDVALAVARRFSAHIEALHVKGDPRDAIPFLGEGASGVLIEQIMTAAERDAGTRSGKAHAVFDSWRAASGLALATVPGEGTGASVAWREEVGTEEECMARRGRVSDVIVVGRPPADDSGASTVLFETALFDTGRPVLVAPPAPSTGVAVVESPVLIFWTGSAEAARAIGGALPLLRISSRVMVMASNSAGKIADAAPLIDYLTWHGVKARTLNPLDITPAAGTELLATAKREGAGLLVMGAYTQSRLRQLIYGSVTKHVLTSAELPVFMAH